jgi:cytochrome P450
MNRSRARLDRMTEAVVAHRCSRGPGEPPDLLDALLAAEDDGSGGGMSPVEIRNNVIALLFAGHETTALALAWAIYLLSVDPLVQDRGAEVSREVLADRPATADDLPRLSGVRRIVEESLRLYPPAAVLSRRAEKDDVLAGHRVAAGVNILVLVYALHRHRDFWSHPDEFDPDRFTEDARAERPRFSYLPFGAGPRICVGAEFALMEATIILSTLLARWRFELAPGFRPEPRMWFTLRPANGILVTARRRD